MKAKRTALLGVLACLVGAAASAQLAPDNGGDIGLFTMPTAKQPEPGHFTLGTYAWLQQLTAGQIPEQTVPEQNRVYDQLAFEGSAGFGITRHWSIFASFGWDQFKSRGGWEGGGISGIPFENPFTVSQGRKLRVGTKVSFFSDNDPDFSLGVWLTSHIPVNNSADVQSQNFDGEANINSRRTDWEWGGVVTKGVFSGMVSYVLAGRQDFDIRPPNLLRFGMGVDVPIIPSLHVIGELDYTVQDGGDIPMPNYSMMNAGVRFWIGQTGIAVSSAFGVNMNLLLGHGNNPAPWGGYMAVTYAAFPPPPPPPVVVPPPPPPAVVEEIKVEVAAPVSPAPPPPTPKKTTDEILFDAGSARLTNIAKAMLDGIALRMKNDLNATAAITGYSDNSGKEDANVAISAKRADAAKEYLVTRHGIDPNRITTSARGSQDAVSDNATPEGRAKNRRAVIVVTLISGA